MYTLKSPYPYVNSLYAKNLILLYKKIYFMAIETAAIHVRTSAGTDIIDITPEIKRIVSGAAAENGQVHLFIPGSTAALTTIEYEGGVVADLQRVFDQIAPPDRDYQHHLRWGDDNGHSHVRAALSGPSLTVPCTGGQLTLGTWQQVVFIDFDTRARSRRLTVQVMGE